ncbi:MAG: hypothetical protein LKG27_03335 [Clostridiaceae bacterium]|jgi:hypothetical protein|nr:hypothetical protein [Clostridiaceae bacterium]
MKKVFLLLLGLIMFLSTSMMSYAGEVERWKSTVLDVYIAKGPYYSIMNDAYYTWVAAANRNILFNVSGTKAMNKYAHIKILFNQGQDGVTSITQNGINLPVVTINIQTNGLNNDQLRAKFLHYVGISIGLNNSSDKYSVMYKVPLNNQSIQYNDLLALYNLYNWNIPKRGLKIKSVGSYKK